MSDQQQGPGWWRASDDKWYPPESAPPVPAETWAVPAPGPPLKPGMSSGGKLALAIIGVVGVIVLAVAAITFLGDDDSTSSSNTTTNERPGTTAGGDQIPAGFEVLEGDGVSIAGPAGWQLIDADDMALGSEEFAALFPDAPPGMVDQGLGLFEQGAVLVAFDFGGGDFSSNVNILDVPGEAPLEDVESEAVRQLGTLGGEVLDSGVVDLPLGRALRIVYTLSLALPDGTSMLAEGVQFYLPADGSTYIITVSAASGAAALGDQMAETFQIG